MNLKYYSRPCVSMQTAKSLAYAGLNLPLIFCLAAAPYPCAGAVRMESPRHMGQQSDWSESIFTRAFAINPDCHIVTFFLMNRFYLLHS